MAKEKNTKSSPSAGNSGGKGGGNNRHQSRAGGPQDVVENRRPERVSKEQRAEDFHDQLVAATESVKAAPIRMVNQMIKETVLDKDTGLVVAEHFMPSSGPQDDTMCFEKLPGSRQTTFCGTAETAVKALLISGATEPGVKVSGVYNVIDAKTFDEQKQAPSAQTRLTEDEFNRKDVNSRMGQGVTALSSVLRRDDDGDNVMGGTD